MPYRPIKRWDEMGFQQVIRELKSRAYYTPDIEDIFSYEYHLVFVDGILKKPFDNHSRFLRHSKFLGDARTLDQNYIMKRGPNFTVTFEDLKAHLKRQVWGELYAVPPEDMLGLDALHANGTMYERQKQYITAFDQLAPFKQGKIRPTVEAWMYLGIPVAWENHEMRFCNCQFYNGVSGWIFSGEPMSS